MMTANSLNHRKPLSLADQIKDTERKRLIREQKISVQADKLFQKIQQEITAPGSLLLACGIGFIMGEFTKRRTPKFRGATTAQKSPLKVAMSLITSAHTLYSALPLTLLIKSFYQSDASGQSLQAQTHPAVASERAAKSQDRRRRPIVPPTKA
jgi:hypothetical protein